MAANNSYEEAVALIAAANRVVQDPNSVGAALRTISLRLRGTSAKELEEAGEDTTGAIESKSKLRSKIKGYTGIDILTDSGAYKSTYEILLEISKVWDDLTDMNRAGLLEMIAGKTRSNTAAAILSNTKDLEEAYKSAMEAEGSAYEENEKYLDSIQGRIDLFNNALQTMWSNALDSDVIKGIVDLGTELIKLIDKIGLIPSLLTAIGITKILPSLLKAITHTETFGGVLKTFAFGAQYANSSIGEIIISLGQMIPMIGQGVTTAGKAIPQLINAGYAFGGLKGAVAGASAGIKGLWAAIPGAGQIMIIVAAISAVVAIVDSLTTSAKEAAKAAEEAVTEYENATKTLKDHSATIEEIKDDYKELADGVDELGRNISLSTDEYKRYNEITNKIADMFPEMVSGYTEEGNAIIALKGNVEALTDAYEKEAQAARDAIIVKSNDIFNTFKHNTTNAGNLWTGTHDELEDLKYIEDLLDGELNNFEFTDFNGTTGLARWFEAAGIEGPSFWDVILGNSTTEDYMDILRENLPQLQAYYRTLKSELDAEVNPIKSLVNAYLGNNEDYQKLSDEGKKIAQTIISGFDTEFYARDEFENWTDVAAWIDTNVIQKLQSTGNLKEFNIAFDLQTQFNNGKISVDDYIEQINEFIKLLEQLGFDNEIITTVKGVFKIDDYEAQKQSAMEILDAEGDKSAGTSLTKDDLDIIDKNKTKWKKELELDGKAEMSWDELIKKIAEAKEMAWSASEEFDKISEAIDGIQDAYSTLSDVVTEYNENGFLSLDNLQALLSLEPEYLACLQMENGQLSINQQALQSMIQARLAEAKATVVQSAMDQLHALAARTEEQAVTDSANAASNAVNGLGAYASALGTVAQDAIVAAGAVTAFNAAVEGAQNNKFVDQSEIDAIMSSMNTRLQMIDSVSANLQTNFNAITGLDKDDTGTGGSGKGDTALDRIKNKYEGKISNLENQQTYIENEIEKLEAEDEAVSKSYYEQQISLEEKKIDLLKQERNELQALYKANPTQETADALWEIEHAIQESALRMVEFRQSIIDLYTTAFDKAITAYDNKDDFLSDQQNYIDKYRQLMEMNDSPMKASGYQEQLNAEWAKKNTNIAELALLEQIYADAMANGLKEGSEEWVDLQDKIRATEEAIIDNNIAIEEYAEAMRQIPVEAFNSVREMFGYQTDFLTKQQDYVEGYADYLEAIGVDVPREVYDKLIEIEQEKRNNTLADLVDARQGLVDIEAQGFTAADEEWQDAYNKITDLEKAIQDSDIAMAQWEKTIRDMDFEKFERFTSRLDDLNSEIEHIKNLLDDEDVAFEDGTWTEEGITSLGLLYQQMQIAEQKSKEYADKIEELNETYQSGSISEQEYYERLQELKEGQWGAIESYEDAKDAIVDMEEARIDMIEEGINEEIEAYQELIDMKKEELDAEKDLYDFKKNIQKQTKDIASLQRRIASMSGSTDASTIAERTKLQAQLREAQEGLDDTYYSHSMDAQSKALDDENEAYAKSKEDYLKMLRDTLDDTAAIINTKISEFLLNADVGLGELNGISQEHGITLSDSLMQPWINASAVSETFKQNADLNLFSLINEDGIVTIFGNTATDAFNDAFGAGGSAATLFTTTVNTKIAEIKFTVEQAKSPLTANLKYPWENTASADGPINTFSETAKNAISSAVTKAQNNAETMKTLLSSPWTSAGSAVNTFSKGVEDALDGAMRKAKEYANTINNLPAPNTPSYIGSGSGGDGGNNNGGNGNNTDSSGTKIIPREDVKQLQQILNQFFSAQLQVDGVYGPATKSAVANMQSWLSITPSGKYDQKTKDAMQKWLNKRNVSSWFRQVGFGIPAAMYAKGTLGTSRDQFAITDESWIGEEITLAAGKNGQLQYLKKGSAVLPSDIANNLVEWGKINPDMSAFSNGLQGMNVMTSVLNKPELNLEFGSLLHIDNCSNEVIPEVKKMVTEALDKFSRQLNYSLRRVGAK